MSLPDASNQSSEETGFVPAWLRQSEAAHPDSDVDRAIVAATAGERLDESRLLRDTPSTGYWIARTEAQRGGKVLKKGKAVAKRCAAEERRRKREKPGRQPASPTEAEAKRETDYLGQEEGES